MSKVFDLFIIGGGINGVGIAIPTPFIPPPIINKSNTLDIKL